MTTGKYRHIQAAGNSPGLHYTALQNLNPVRSRACRRKIPKPTANRRSSVSISERTSGRGTIRFGQAGPVWSQRGFNSWMPSLDATPQFLGIENAREVFDQIQRL